MQAHTNDLVHEARHRCASDLQMVTSLIELTRRRTADETARAALGKIANRVHVFAETRGSLLRGQRRDLGSALRMVCEALHTMAEPAGVTVALSVEHPTPRPDDEAILAVALSVNEIVTNALKHAFVNRVQGRVEVICRTLAERTALVSIDDDGVPFPSLKEGQTNGSGAGLGLVRRMIDQQGGMVIMPTNGSKRFEIRVPAR